MEPMIRKIRDKQIAPTTMRALQQAGLLAVIYVGLIFLLPASQATMKAYGISAFEYHIVLFAVTLPLILAWTAAFVGYAKLRQYVDLIIKTPEGAHFESLATGCKWLAWSLPLTAIFSLALNSIANQWPSFYHPSIIAGNYLTLLFAIVAFSIIGNSSRGLMKQGKLLLSLIGIRVIMLVFLIIGVLYCLLTFQHFDLTNLGATSNPYFLPIWLMVVSVVIPYLYSWFTGLLAAYEIILYSQHANGVLYRQALRLLAIGLVTIIVSSIALQYMSTVQPRVGHLVLSYKVVLSSLFRIIGGAGFVLLAIGAIRLKKIEEV